MHVCVYVVGVDPFPCAYKNSFSPSLAPSPLSPPFPAITYIYLGLLSLPFSDHTFSALSLSPSISGFDSINPPLPKIINMSTTSLPGYLFPTYTRTPAYTAEPQGYEQRLALNRVQARPSGDFVKSSKSGGISLRLTSQDRNAELPIYGCSSSVEGVVHLSKPDNVTAVELKVCPTLILLVSLRYPPNHADVALA